MTHSNTSVSNEFLASYMGSLSGITEEKLDKIAPQRWLTIYTNGYDPGQS